MIWCNSNLLQKKKIAYFCWTFTQSNGFYNYTLLLLRAIIIIIIIIIIESANLYLELFRNDTFLCFNTIFETAMQ